MTNLHDLLHRARTAGQRLLPGEAGVLFAAAVRVASAQGATLRSRLVGLDDDGTLHLSPFNDQQAEIEPGYLAPELLAADAPRKSEPRVQVYAAGALGYELFTGKPPPGPGEAAGPELSGPLGDLVRMALSTDRRERFGDLTQLYDAVLAVHQLASPEAERQAIAGLRARSVRWGGAGLEKEALARVIEKLGLLESQVGQLSVAHSLAGKAHQKLEVAHRQALERIDRAEDGSRRAEDAQRKRPGLFLPLIGAALLGALLTVGAGWALGIVPVPAHAEPKQEAARGTSPLLPAPDQAAPAEKLAKAEPAAAGAVPADKPDAGALAAAAEAGPDQRAEASADAGAAAQAAIAGPTATGFAATAIDSGSSSAVPPADAAVALDAGRAKAAEPATRKRSHAVAQAALAHAVAVSQVKRGESALEHGRAEEALDSFRAALQDEPTLPIAFRGLGMAYAMQGKDAQALQSYERYLQLVPSAADARDIRRSITELKARARIGAGEK